MKRRKKCPKTLKFEYTVSDIFIISFLANQKSLTNLSTESSTSKPVAVSDQSSQIFYNSSSSPYVVKVILKIQNFDPYSNQTTELKETLPGVFESRPGSQIIAPKATMNHIRDVTKPIFDISTQISRQHESSTIFPENSTSTIGPSSSTETGLTKNDSLLIEKSGSMFTTASSLVSTQNGSLSTVRPSESVANSTVSLSTRFQTTLQSTSENGTHSTENDKISSSVANVTSVYNETSQNYSTVVENSSTVGISMSKSIPITSTETFSKSTLFTTSDMPKNSTVIPVINGTVEISTNSTLIRYENITVTNPTLMMPQIQENLTTTSVMINSSSDFNFTTSAFAENVTLSPNLHNETENNITIGLKTTEAPLVTISRRDSVKIMVNDSVMPDNKSKDLPISSKTRKNSTDIFDAPEVATRKIEKTDEGTIYLEKITYFDKN